jgi:predicted Zn-dependent protease
MKKLFFLVWLLLDAAFCFSQQASVCYKPARKDSIVSYINTISEKKIAKFGAKYKRDIKEIIQERKIRFIKNIEDSSYVFDPKISSYLNDILRKIYVLNTNINSNDFYFFIDKSPIPNAASYGNGIFTVNLGLFNFVNSDDELAFILCHEMAHFELDHTDKSMLRHFETLRSKDIKNKINKVKRKQYGKRKAYYDLVEELNYNFLKRSRADELQADSLGLAIFSKTKFNKAASVSALRNLQLSDTIIFNENSKIQELLNFETYPFKESWLLKDQTLFDTDKSVDDYSFDKDSLKTHPDISLRIQILNKTLNNNAESISIEASTDKLKAVKQYVALMTISNSLDEKRLDFALYQTLVCHNKKEIDDKTYVTIVSQLLQNVYELKSNHKFGKYVSPISPFSDEKYLNEVRQFLHNIELKNIKKIGFNFCKKYQDIMKDDVNFNKISTYFNKLNL